MEDKMQYPNNPTENAKRQTRNEKPSESSVSHFAFRISRFLLIGCALILTLTGPQLLAGGPGVGLNDWSQCQPVPLSGSLRLPGRGAGIAVVGDRIFALIGNRTNDFAEYSIRENRWSLAAPVPRSPARNKKIGVGSTIVSDEENIYVLRGKTKEFYRYQPAADRWETLPQPTHIRDMENAFACYVSLAGRRFIYAASGNGRRWMRYDIQRDTWESTMPVQLPISASAGSCLVSDPFGLVYFLRGGDEENRFCVTNLNSPMPTWTACRSLPLSVPDSRKRKHAREGTSLVCYDSKIYAVKGGSREFWCYEPLRDTWIYSGIAGGPGKAIKCSQPLAAHESGIYCLFANNTDEFARFRRRNVGIDGEALPGRDQVQGKDFGSSPAGLALRVSPNPLSDNGTVHYSLPKKCPVRLTLRDAAGRLVQTLADGAREAGSYSVPIIPGTLPKGIYVLRLEAGTANLTQKLVRE
jgi:hypothetical protein